MSQKRVFGLDLLRFFAIFFVLYNHAGHFFPLRDKINIYAKILYDGVGIFFVLSGFLIGSILIKQLLIKDLNSKILINFWKQRWSRTLPNYFLFLLLTIFLDFLFNDGGSKSIYKYYFVFLQNFNNNVFTFFDHSWSLSVEEWYYLLIPFFIFLFIKSKLMKPKVAFMIVCFLVIFIINFIRISKYYSNEIMTFDEYKNIEYAVTCRLDGIMYGMLGAYIKHYHENIWNKLKLPGIIIGVFGLILYYLTPLKYDLQFKSLYSFTLTSITVLAFIPYLSSLRDNNTKVGKFITFVSLTSYSLYLVNSLLTVVISNLPIWDDVYNFVYNNINKQHSWGIIFSILYVFFWVGSFVISAFVYKYFEIPTTNYFRKKKVIQ
ncbi:acyltransferase [Chishuiella changwenlii]|uniref:acyltransferase family protein n=1 Tax=Chishuiella changwenlii TaxID=1434701 RepID=UPI002FD97C35